MKLRSNNLTTVLNARASTGVDYANGFHVEDFRNLVIELSSSGNANLTVKFQGSVSDEAPDFGAAQSADNHWEFINIVDLQDGSPINGDDGIVLSGADDFRLFEVNVNGLKFFNARVTSRIAGSVTIKVKPFTND